MVSQFDFSTGMNLLVAYLQVPFVLKKIEYKGVTNIYKFLQESFSMKFFWMICKLVVVRNKKQQKIHFLSCNDIVEPQLNLVELCVE